MNDIARVVSDAAGSTRSSVAPIRARRPRILISHQGCIPIYRSALFERLDRIPDIDYVVAYGDPPSGTHYVVAQPPYSFTTLKIENREFVLGSSSLIWQPLVAPFWKEFDAAILGDEIKYISHWAIIIAARLRRRPVVFWGFGYPSGSRQHEGLVTPARRVVIGLRSIFRRVIWRFIDGYLVYTQSGAESLAKCGMPNSRIATVRNTVDIEQEFRFRATAEGEDEEKIRGDLGVPTSVPVFLYFGRYLAEKRVDLLIDYANLSAGRGRNVCIILSGVGAEQDRLITRAAGSANVVFKSLFGLDLARALRIASAVVIPGFAGLAITHAFAHRVPFLTREGIVHSPEIDYLIHGENGLLLPHERGEFFAALDRYLDDSQLQERLRRGARETASDLSMDAMAASFDGLIRRLLQQNGFLPETVPSAAPDGAFEHNQPVTEPSGKVVKAMVVSASSRERGGCGSLDVSVCICTFARAHITETILSVLRQNGLEECNFEIIVADDDPLYSARSAVAQVAATTAIPVRYVQSGARNVAIARNACLDAARGEWIAFIDDDEIAKPNWLASLLAARNRYCADVVKGAVNAVYPAETPYWIKQADPYTRDYGPTGRTPTKLATGNILFDRSLFEAPVRRFDPGFGRSGGEDTEFFRRVQRAGAKIVASREAVVEEVVPIERATRSYLSGRARRIGQVEVKKARLGLDDESIESKVTFAILAVLMLWIHPFLRPLGARVSYKTFAKFWYSIGIIEGAALARSDEMSG